MYQVKCQLIHQKQKCFLCKVIQMDVIWKIWITLLTETSSKPLDFLCVIAISFQIVFTWKLYLKKKKTLLRQQAI